MIVVELGGAAVRDAEAIARAARTVRERLEQRPIVVVPAMPGVTGLLRELSLAAAAGDEIGARARHTAIRLRHLAEVRRLACERPERGVACVEVMRLCDELEALMATVLLVGGAMPRLLDAIAGLGERLALPLVVATLRSHAVPACAVDARRVVIVDDRLGAAVPDTAAIADAARSRLVPLVNVGLVPVIADYNGATRDGCATTLERDGSDRSAVLIGAAVGATAIEILTNVRDVPAVDAAIAAGRVSGMIRLH